MPGPYHEYNRQQAAERVSKAYREGLAKETRKHRVATAKRSSMVGPTMAWMVRLFGGGGGI